MSEETLPGNQQSQNGTDFHDICGAVIMAQECITIFVLLMKVEVNNNLSLPLLCFCMVCGMRRLHPRDVVHDVTVTEMTQVPKPIGVCCITRNQLLWIVDVLSAVLQV
jgi:hypothetical protein